VGVVVLIGGLVLANAGRGVPPAEATGNNQGNPFTQILNKLDEILAKLNNGNGNHTLRWDQVLPAATRFAVLADFGGAAVLDKETGLVWEQSPATTTHTWSAARFQCRGRTTGGRRGWRLPSVHELASLVDPSVAPPGPTLPASHPFANFQAFAHHWSASTDAENPALAWNVLFSFGTVDTAFKINTFLIWCVRGGHNDGSEY
jgi:hypothetical protein